MHICLHIYLCFAGQWPAVLAFIIATDACTLLLCPERSQLYKLLRCTCLHCFKLKMSGADVERFRRRLELLSQVREGPGLATALAAPGLQPCPARPRCLTSSPADPSINALLT